MRIKHLLLCTTTLLKIYYVHGHCIDIHSRIVSQGLHYVPGGTNPCTLCICDKGGPKWCKSVLCSPPQNCKSFQVGSSCCEFKCLDDILSGHDNYKETYDVALRFIASTVTAVLSISLLFFLYNRLKRNKSLQHHTHQHEEQRNLSNVGYITGSFGYNQPNMGYLGSGNNEIEIRYEETPANFSLWKPPGNYFPPGEAPPPYEEAMRSAQNDITSHNLQNTTTHNTLINSFTSAYPQEINPALICRHDEPPPTMPMLMPQSTAIMNVVNNEIPNISSNTHQYVNVRVQVQQHNEHKNKQEHTKLISSKPEVSYENITALKNCASDRQERHARRERPTSSGFIKPTSSAYHKSRSRTSLITTPSVVTVAAETIPPSSNVTPAPVLHKTSTSSFSVRENYELVPVQVPQPHAVLNNTHSRSHSHLQSGQNSHPYSRYVNDGYSKIKLSEYNTNMRGESNKKNLHRTLPKNLRELLSHPEGLKLSATFANAQHAQMQHIQQTTHGKSFETLLETIPKVTFSTSSTPKIDSIGVLSVQPPQQPTTTAEVRGKDKEPKNLLTYQSLSQDEEDYRSECENCKSVVTAGDDDGEAMNETMSLQRRPLSESGYELSYRTSLTLPTNTRKQQQRSYPCTTNTREKRFTSMQETSSEESD